MNKNDERIEALLAKVAAKKKEMGTKKRPAWKTNCSYKSSGGMLNIQVLDEDGVVELAKDIIAESVDYNYARSKLGLDPKPYIFSGFDAEDWLEDLKFRIYQINYAKQEKELASLEKKLKGLLSQDKKTEKEIDDLEGLL